MFDELERINTRPEVFCAYTTDLMWTDAHISERMLASHLDGRVDVASRNNTFIAQSTAWLIDRFELGEGKRVLDLGCGPGLYTNRLARSGAMVTGVDISERSIKHAHDTATTQAVPAFYVCDDYLTWESDEDFDLILMVMWDFCAMNPEQRAVVLAKVASMLRPGGRFVFDVQSYLALEMRQETAIYGPNLMDGFFSPGPYFGFFNTYVYEEQYVSLEKFEIIEQFRSVTYCNWIQHYDPSSLAGELGRSGLDLEDMFGDVAGSPYTSNSAEFAAIARII